MKLTTSVLDRKSRFFPPKLWNVVFDQGPWEFGIRTNSHKSYWKTKIPRKRIHFSETCKKGRFWVHPTKDIRTIPFKIDFVGFYTTRPSFRMFFSPKHDLPGRLRKKDSKMAKSGHFSWFWTSDDHIYTSLFRVPWGFGVLGKMANS